jgi:quinol monooxygenase YgiN
MTKVALLVELKAKPQKVEEVAQFLAGAQPLAMAEPGTITWYAARLSTDTFMIFDTFADDAGRQAHLSGPIAAALMAHADDLLAEPPQIRQAEILADKPPG